MTGDDAAVMGGQHERLSVEVKVDSTHKCGQPVPLCGWSQAINRSSTVTQMLQNRSTDRDYKVILSHNSASPDEIYCYTVKKKGYAFVQTGRANGKAHSHHSSANVV